MELEHKTYFKNLDATRALAFLMVFVGHMFINYDFDDNTSNFFQFFNLGRFGVDYFFVLSGFLITWSALINQKTNVFSYKNFIFRRILRIWPLYFIIVFIGFFSDSFGYQIEEIPSAIFFISFTTNLYSASCGDEFLFFLVIIWSVAIEFQFYVIWGLVLKYCQKYIFQISFLFIVLSLIFRYYFLNINQNQDQLYYHTFGAFGNFGIGALVALILYKRGFLLNLLCTKTSKYRIYIYCILMTCLLFHFYIFSNSYSRIFERLFYAILFGYVIIDQVISENERFKFGKSKLLNHMGKISYGLYCYHAVVISFVVYLLKYFEIQQNIYLTVFVYPLVVFSLTFLISKWSYDLIESWFLKIKKEYY